MAKQEIKNPNNKKVNSIEKKIPKDNKDKKVENLKTKKNVKAVSFALKDTLVKLNIKEKINSLKEINKSTLDKISKKTGINLSRKDIDKGVKKLEELAKKNNKQKNK